jgi:hypothetical protein
MHLIGGTAMGSRASKLFLYPGTVVADALHATREDDRVMIRTLVNMLVWNLILVLAVFEIFR